MAALTSASGRSRIVRWVTVTAAGSAAMTMS
jgi:hypothetical protein